MVSETCSHFLGHPLGKSLSVGLEVTMIFELSSNFCSINLKCCINTWEYLILTIKKRTVMENLERDCSYRIMFPFH